MKNTIRLSIWAALIVVAGQVNAADPKSDLEVSKIGSKTFELSISNLRGDVDFYFKDENNKTIYNATLSNNGSVKKIIDMRNLSDGQYLVEWTDEEKRELLPVTIFKGFVSIKTQEKQTHLFPTLKQKGNMISVNMLALNGESLYVKVLNSSRELIYKETLEGKGNLGKRYDFSNAQKGKYKFQLISDGNVITKEVTID